MMDTSLSGSFLQGNKRLRFDDSDPSPIRIDSRIRNAINQLRQEPSLPESLKIVISYVIERTDQMDALVNSSLPADSNVPVNTDLPRPLSSTDSKSLVDAKILEVVEEKERLRSVVISNIPESAHPSFSVRNAYDGDCVRKILEHLSIDCTPLSFYRMGRPYPGRFRLMKIVFPSRFYRDLILRNAPRMRYFPGPAVFIRPSLTKAERESYRAQWRKSRSFSQASVVRSSPHPQAMSSEPHTSPLTNVNNSSSPMISSCSNEFVTIPMPALN
ncbi:hypothetical protein OESDEN_23024 [Oesophagostomum dentatum]|uniref:Uncharacterized protein n=1 Tax=Oesophagostomum dentatum TaxID=61180 RepID=A0A0B1S0C3_OESDE|nr:hypothetical protein OESDEN_23024 [Oesophagostomum dentatum]